MIPESAGLDRQCAGAAAVPKPAAAINWFGITDVGDVIDGPNRANAAMTWFGSLPNRDEIAKRVSPLTYVRAGLPPILTIHGDADRVVPYQHAVRLHDALTKAGVPNQLLTIPGGGHGNFTPEQRTMIYVDDSRVPGEAQAVCRARSCPCRPRLESGHTLCPRGSCDAISIGQSSRRGGDRHGRDRRAAGASLGSRASSTCPSR